MEITHQIQNINGEEYLVRLENGVVAFKAKLSNVDFNPEHNKSWLKEHFKVVSVTHSVKQ